MEKAKAKEAVETSLKKLDLNFNSNNPNSKTAIISTFRSSRVQLEKPKPPSLVSLCLGMVGRHFEDILEDLADIAASFPSDIKMAFAAIARRRKLLNDEVIIALVESSWEILDLSGSDVSDFGLSKVAESKHLRAIDISHCSKITYVGVSKLLQQSESLEILRWGGCPRSDYAARSSLCILKPKLHVMEEESWEELDTTEICHGAPSLRWLVWPNIDKDSLETLSTECPRIIVNPKPSPFGYRGIEIPKEAFPNTALDDPYVSDINPRTWANHGFIPRTVPSTVSVPSNELSIAEKFRLAFVERDSRLAPKRAKNMRQQQRRAEREWVMMSESAKALALASQLSKSLHSRN